MDLAFRFPAILSLLVVCLFCIESKKTFFLTYSETCNITIADLTDVVIQQQNNLVGLQKRRLQNTDYTNLLFKNLPSLIDNLSQQLLIQRLEQTQKKAFNPYQNASPSNRKLSQNKALSRDLLLATLKVLVELGTGPSSGRNRQLSVDDFKILNAVSTSNFEYLPHINVDVIYDSSNDDAYFKYSHFLPCLESPPEEDDQAYFHTTWRPDDLLFSDCDQSRIATAHQWNLLGPKSKPCAEPFGTGIDEAWTLLDHSKAGRPVVAVLDTGCGDHPDLNSNYCTADEDCAGYDFGEMKESPFVKTGGIRHGTAVASIIGAQGNNGYGVPGVCWNCKIMCIKMLSADGKFYRSTIIKALNYIAGKTLQGVVKISVHSYGTIEPLASEARALRALSDTGHLIVNSAGNDACDMGSSKSSKPSCVTRSGRRVGFIGFAQYAIPNLIVVAATQRDGQVSSTTNWGKSYVNIFAPGVSILVLDALCKLPMVEGRYLSNGTSYAAPMVAGVAALLLKVNPDLTSSQLADIILSTARVLPRYKDLVSSSGLLDAPAAIRKVYTDYMYITPQAYSRPDIYKMYSCLPSWA